MSDVMSQQVPDPASRLLDLAIRSTRLLGFCSAVFGLVFLLAFGYFNRYRVYAHWGVMIGLVIWFVPGVLLMTCAVMLRHRRRGAAFGAMLITCAHLLFAVAALVGSCTLEPVSPIPIVMSGLWVLAAAQLIHYLWRSLPLLMHDADVRKGFEVQFKEPQMSADERR